MPVPPRITLTRRDDGAVSGKWSAAWILLSLAVSAILLPVAAHLPRWVEYEMVLGAWWVIWTIALSALLYRGSAIADDAEAPDSPAFPWSRRKSKSIDSGGDSTSWARGCSSIDLLVGDGCGEVFAVVALIFAVIIGVWLMIEVVLPAVAFGLYFAIRGMLARVANDRKDCRGSVLRSAFWGALWAFAYTAPLTLIVWGVHAVHRHYAG